MNHVATVQVGEALEYLIGEVLDDFEALGLVLATKALHIT